MRVATLNSASFAGHNDWRLPNVKELESIINYQNDNPSVSTAFNTECTKGCKPKRCSCTATSPPAPPNTTLYWSSTTFAGAPSEAWHVDFDDGHVLDDLKGSNFHFVRAVRGTAP